MAPDSRRSVLQFLFWIQPAPRDLVRSQPISLSPNRTPSELTVIAWLSPLFFHTFDVWKNSGESHAITVSSLGVRFGDSDIGWLWSKSRGAGWIQNRNCKTERRLSGAILQETLSLPVFQRCPAGLDQLRINKRRSGTKLLRSAEKCTPYS